jgi:hypothetical protein
MVLRNSINPLEFEQEILELLSIKDQINELKKIKKRVRVFMESNRESPHINLYYINLKKELLIFLQSDNAYSKDHRKPLRIEKLKKNSFIYKILNNQPEILTESKGIIYLRDQNYGRDIILNLNN